MWACVGLQSDVGLCRLADCCGIVWVCRVVWNCVGLQAGVVLCRLAVCCGLVWACSLVWVCVNLQTGVGLQTGLVLQITVDLCGLAD
jgi:hypothetical protein